jgi:hypothetical protein
MQLDGWTAVFLWSTVATSLMGFPFPFHHFIMTSHVAGILSPVVLGVALYARYARKLAGAWRRTYAVSAMIALYLNVFILVAQLFAKVPALKAFPASQSQSAFKLTQLIVLAIFVVLAVFATIRSRSEQLRAA